MSEVQSRPAPARGRGSTRGGRGSYGARGGARSRHAVNGDRGASSSTPSFEEEGEMGELKRKYASKLGQVKELFPDWTDEDIVYALQETDGDLEATITRITDGSVSQWGEVKKKTKDRSRSKAKEASGTAGESVPSNAGASGRGVRAARGVADGTRGGRSRGGDRGRGASRAGRGSSTAPVNGATGTVRSALDAAADLSKASVPTDESNAWGSTKTAGTDSLEGGWGDSEPSIPVTTQAPTKSRDSTQPTSSVIPGGTKKSWASMFAEQPPAPAPVKPVVTQPSQQPPTQGIPPQAPQAAPPSIEKNPSATPAFSDTEPDLTPSKDELTETNLEHVPDTSAPAPTATAASTVASSKDPRSGATSATPYATVAQGSQPRSSLLSYATQTAYNSNNKGAPGTPGRSSSYQRRVLDQQEAVVMPGNHAVDRATVQFGSMGIGAGGEDGDVDEDREDAVTRAQPPQHSPVAHPRASLPPAPMSQDVSGQAIEAEPTPKQAPGLPAVPQSQVSGTSSSQTSAAPVAATQHPAAQQQTAQAAHAYGGFNRYGQPAAEQDQSGLGHKGYDAFGQSSSQVQSQNQYDPYASQSQSQETSAQHQQQPSLGAFSSAPNEQPSYYTADQQRNAYAGYYGSQYGQHAHGHPELSAGQRSGSYGPSDSASQYQLGGQQANLRYGQAAESQGSGQNTPGLPGQPQHSTQQQSQHQQQQQQTGQPQGQAAGQNAYPYNHPYYSTPYYNYMNQYYGQGYGAPYNAKGGMYGQPHQGYGMSPQTSYEHSSSPANISGFNQPSMHGRDSGLGGGASDYGRSGSSQLSHGQQQTGGAGLGGVPDVFGRSGFQSQGQTGAPTGQGSSQAAGGVSGSGNSGDEALKAFSDAKAGGGPSPALGGQPGRPGSTAASNATSGSGGPPGQGYPSQGQAGQQQQQQQQQYGGYPSHLNHHLQGGQGGSAQYGGLGGLGGAQQSHQSGYGNYGAGFGGSYYGSGGRGGGWGSNYGH